MLYIIILSGLIFGITYIGLYKNNTKTMILKTILNQMLKKDLETDFKINETGKSAILKYSRYGKTYILNIPYKREFLTKMNNTKVFLVKNNQNIDITQQPGIPYMINAEMLGGDKILVYKHDQITEYSKNQIPDF